MITWEKIEEVNKEMKGIDFKGKDYVEVNQRVKAFRKLCPNGTISTNIESLSDGVVVIKATILDENGKVLATGLAYEKEQSSFINKTSYIENCETSAVGRALGFVGLGIDASICSAQELCNAVVQQKYDISKEMKERLSENGITDLEKIRTYYNVKVLTDKECQKALDLYKSQRGD